MRVRKALAAGLVAGLLAVVIGAAAPATAAPAWPSGWNPKQFMINVLGSVLSAAGGDNPYKRAVIAADQKFDHSWEALEQAWKKPGSAGAPATYQDYVLQKQEYFNKNNLTSIPGDVNHPNSKKYVATAKPPSTKATTLKKIGAVGGPLVALTAYEFRADIANGIVGLFGIDTNGAVCSNPVASEGFINFITGQDCAPYKFAQEYVPNFDASPRQAGWINNRFTWTGDVGPGQNVFEATGSPSGTGTKTITATTVYSIGSQGGSGSVSSAYTVLCRSAGGAFSTSQLSGNLSVTQGASATMSLACGANQLYALGRMSTTNNWPGQSIFEGGRYIRNSPGDWLYFSSLSPSYKPAESGDPGRTLECEIRGDDGNTYRSQSQSYTESGGQIAAPQCPTLPPGVGAENIILNENANGVTKPLLDQPTTEEYQQWWQQYPECREGACSLDLIQTQKENRSCFSSIVDSEACRDWFTTTDRDTKYKCTYGVHAVSLTECYVYADVFKPEKVIGGQPYTDPKTGDAVPGQSSPGAAKIALGRVITDPTNFAGCLDTGWAAANPVEWVVIPIQCAMQWAFAPRPGVIISELAGLEQGWAKKPPAVIATTVSQWNVTPTMSGCAKTVDFLGSPLPVWNVCPGSPYEWMAITSRLILNISVTVGVVWAVRRMTGSTVNYVDG